MSLSNKIVSLCNQTAVYWSNPTNTGIGNYTFDEPYEIKCRWEDVSETVKTRDGREIISRSKVWTLEDIDEEGYLYLGTFDDFESDIPNPNHIQKAYKVMKFEKAPHLNGTEFLRIAYL